MDTAPAIFESLRLACEGVGVRIDPQLDLSFALGPPLHRCLERLGVPPTLMPDAIVAFERAHTDRLHLCAPMPGVREVFETLARRGTPVGIVTIKPQAIAGLVLTSVGLASFVTAVHGRSDDLDPRTKTDLLREALDDPALAGPRPVYMGDHDNDEVAARELGVPFLSYPQTPWESIGRIVLAP